MHAFIALLKRFHSDERGIFAVIFGVMALVLVALAGAAVDYTSMETARTRAQIALDSAALGLGPKIYDDDVTEEELMADAQAVVRERLANVPQVIVNVTAADINDEAGTLRLTGDVTVPMAFVQLVGIPTLTAGIVSEATKGSINLEVALAIDITKSMEDTEDVEQITALIRESKTLINAIVKEDQEPTYSKMALIPWSMGVNVGALADAVRGEPNDDYTNITAASWTSSSKSVSNATKANPAVITSNAHGFSTDDRVWISSVKGMTELNDKIYCVVKVNNNSFQLKSTSSGGTVCGSLVNSSNYHNFNSNQLGTAKKCVVNTCKIRVTSLNHGMSNGQPINIRNVNGMTQLNDRGWIVESATTDTFVLQDVVAPTTYGTYSNNSGRVYCAWNIPDQEPCKYYRYVAADNTTVRAPAITNCVTERETERYTNEIPSEVWLGRHYPDGNSLNSCIGNEIVPLTSVKQDLIDAVDVVTPAGSTAGHIGLAWAWYLLSHDFGEDLFPVDSESIAANPEADGAEPVLKVIVLMTDGLFNTNYCNGVVAKNADSVAGSGSQRANCDGVNSTTQGEALCTAIDEDEDNDIVIYTVAFALQEIADEEDRETVRQMLADCATEDGGAYNVTNGVDLGGAFAEIARNINDLRLSL